MKGNMFKGISVAMAALVVTVLVGCGGNNTAAPAPVPPVTNQPGYGGGAAGCGVASTGLNNFFSYLQIQYNGLTGGQQGMQQGGLPSSLSLTIQPQTGQTVIGQPQQVTASGCFNWAELAALYGPTYPGQPQQNRQTAVQITSQNAFTQINPDGSFQNMQLTGTANLPSFGVAASPTPIVLFIPQGRVISFQGNHVQAQQILVYVGGQTQQPAAVYIAQ